MQESNSSEENKDSHFSDNEVTDIVKYALLHEAIQAQADQKKEKFWPRVRTVLGNVRKAARRERIETVIAARIIRKYLVEREITEEEKKFLKDQSIDIARILPIVAIQAIPAPVPVTPLLIAFGRKIGIDVLPKEQEIPDTQKRRKDSPPDAPS